MVATQDPAAGTEVAPGSSVRLVVSSGLQVPDVVGRQAADAATPLGRFEVQQTTVHSREPYGQVIGQDPRPPARRPAGAAVRLEVSDGSLVLVPPVEQQALESAQAELAPLDLRAEIEEVEGDLAPGVVATQDPAAGTEVSRGSTIRLVVSTGLPVPDVVGRKVADAETLLTRFEVEQSAVGSTEPPGQVIDQAPRAPARAAAGSRVALVVSDGSQAGQPSVGSGPAIPAEHDGFTWPRWLTYLTVLLAGAGVFQAVRLRLRPPPPEPHVSARVESDLGSVEVTDVGLVGPEIHVSARLDAGDCDIRLEGDST
jgi:beta-lactam-binding protein with PASTA domain